MPELRLKTFKASYDEGYETLTDSFNDWVRTHSPNIQGINWFAVEQTKALYLVAVEVLGQKSQPQIIPVVMPPRGGPRDRN